jgi:release factor glutamine methyltransferase
MTAREVQQLAGEKLMAVYSRGEAEAIARNLSHYLKDHPLAAENLDNYLERLLNHEPLQYVIGEAWFCNLKFRVDKNVLIPRPETEELVEWVISNCKFPVKELRILDIGTGSGCIAITLKRRIRKAHVTAIDNSEQALALAKKNAATLGAGINFAHLDFLDPAARSSLEKFDLIISNPPYIPDSDREKMDKNVKDHEPWNALFVSDEDPLSFYKAIAAFASGHLLPGGQVFVETHYEYAQKTVLLFEQKGFDTETRKDMQGNERMVKAWMKAGPDDQQST